MEKSVQIDNGKRIVTWEPEDCEEYVPEYIECKNLPEEYDDIVECFMLVEPDTRTYTVEAFTKWCDTLKFAYALWKLLPEAELDYYYRQHPDSYTYATKVQFGNGKCNYYYCNSMGYYFCAYSDQQGIICKDNYKNALYRLCGVENLDIFNTKGDSDKIYKEGEKLYFELIAKGDELRKKTLIIPEGTKTIKRWKYSKIKEWEYKKIVIPKSVEDIDCLAFPERCGKLFEVDKENKFYKVEENCLIKRNEKGEKVVIYGNDDAIIPEDVDVIGERSFARLMAKK